MKIPETKHGPNPHFLLMPTRITQPPSFRNLVFVYEKSHSLPEASNLTTIADTKQNLCTGVHALSHGGVPAYSTIVIKTTLTHSTDPFTQKSSSSSKSRSRPLIQTGNYDPNLPHIFAADHQKNSTAQPELRPHPKHYFPHNRPNSTPQRRHCNEVSNLD